MIETDGEAAVKVGDIAAAAEVTKPSIYHFFGDREGLVVAALAEMYRRALAEGGGAILQLTQAAATAEEFADNLSAVVKSFGSADGMRRRALRAEVLGASVTRPRLRAALATMHYASTEDTVAAIELARARGFTRMPFDARTAAFWASSLVAARYFVEVDDNANVDEWDAMTVAAIRHILLGSDRHD